MGGWGIENLETMANPIYLKSGKFWNFYQKILKREDSESQYENYDFTVTLGFRDFSHHIQKLPLATIK